MDNYDVISSLFYSYYFSHGKSNPRQTLMLIQLTTCVGPGCRTRPMAANLDYLNLDLAYFWMI